ncbi:MAG: metallophosphoesterase [Planctomycetota bacterium]|jgi:predicted MPP superfamily phosphohydrolase
MTRRRFLKVAGATGIAGVAAGAYAFGVEPTWLRTVRHEVPVHGLDPRLDGLRIVQLSDLHVGAGVPLDYLREAVDRALALEPDAIVVTGDFVHRGGKARAVRDACKIVQRLRAPLGTFGVLGNHDHGVYNGNGQVAQAGDGRIVEQLGAAGLRVLQNQATVLEPAGGGAVRLVGYADLWSGGFDPVALPSDPSHPTIALSHNPDTAPELASRTDAALVLCGHTHGGQVNIPFMGPPILPVANRQFAAGLYDIGDTRLYVNRGVGWLRRVRLFVRPEVTLHVLRAT